MAVLRKRHVVDERRMTTEFFQHFAAFQAVNPEMVAVLKSYQMPEKEALT